MLSQGNSRQVFAVALSKTVITKGDKFGIAITINGLMMIFAGRKRHGRREWTLGGLIMGILYVVFGIFVLGHPFVTTSILVWLFSIWAIVSGIIAIVMAFQLRGLAASK